jgi:hypothetical protein
MVCAQTHDIDLSHQLVREAERPVVIRQVVPRLEAGGPACADDPVDFAGAIKERGERLGVGDVDPLARMARGDDALAGPKRT